MAVYTHFGGIKGDRGLGSKRLQRRAGLDMGLRPLQCAPDPRTDDPMADLMAGGLAYGEFAFQHPQLYRLMFGLANRRNPPRPAPNLDAAETWRSPTGVEAFSVLLESVERVIDAGDSGLRTRARPLSRSSA